MNKSVSAFIVLILVTCLIAGFLYFQEKSEINTKEPLNNDLNNQPKPAWNDITPEYFLSDDIFDTDAKTDLRELNIPGNEKLDKMFKRSWYDENKVPFITLIVIEYKDRFFDSENNIQTKSGSVYNISENTTMTYLGGFTFQNEIINEYKIETKQEQDVKTSFHLKWVENKYSFSIKTSSPEYQEDMKEIAKNIIERYPK